MTLMCTFVPVSIMYKTNNNIKILYTRNFVISCFHHRLYIYREQNITIAVSFSPIAFITPCVYHTAGLVCSITTETAGSGKTYIVLTIFLSTQ